MKTIRVAGVPEHFNLPWLMAIEDATFNEKGLDVKWQDFPDGTGAMCKALREKAVDVAVILTEGIVKDILAGNDSKIVQEYIASPLIWGIHVAEGSDYKDLQDLKNKKVAISRYGSGSHLMAYVNAKNLGWDPEELEFEIVRDINGAVEALKTGRAAYFMWEHFTTKPLVNNGTFRRLGDCPTPWSCFVIAVRQEFLMQEPAAVLTMLKTINSVTKNFKSIPGVEIALSKRYEQKKEDILQWLNVTTWSQKQISIMEIEKVQDQLQELGLISEKWENSRFLSNL